MPVFGNIRSSGKKFKFSELRLECSNRKFACKTCSLLSYMYYVLYKDQSFISQKFILLNLYFKFQSQTIFHKQTERIVRGENTISSLVFDHSWFSKGGHLLDPRFPYLLIGNRLCLKAIIQGFAKSRRFQIFLTSIHFDFLRKYY